MTVQELFQSYDKEKTFLTFLITNPSIFDFTSVPAGKRTDVVSAIKSLTIETGKRICTAPPISPKISNSKKTIFVVEKQNESYECPDGLGLDVFFVLDQEVIESLKNSIISGNEEDKFIIKHFNIQFLLPEEISGFNISMESLNRYGKEQCCAAILRDLCELGLDDESKTNNRKIIEKNLIHQDLDQYPEHPQYIQDTELLEILVEAFSDSLSDDDKEYHRLYMNFKNQVKDIEERYRKMIVDDNNSRIREIVNTEFSRLIRD